MFDSDGAWQEEYEALKEAPKSIEAFRGQLGRQAKTLLDYCRLTDEYSVRLSQLIGYASCKNDEDIGNSFYQGLRSKAMSVCVAMNSAMSFAAPEIMAIPEETLCRFYREEQELETYRRSLYAIRRRAAHILSDDCERLLASAGEMADSPDSIGSIFRNAELRFPDVTDSEGRTHALTNGTFVPLLESSDVRFRRTVFETYYNRLGEYKNTVAAILDAQFKQLRFFSDARR